MIIRRVNILLFITMMIFGFNLTCISPMLIEISEEFSLSLTQAGLIFTYYNIGFIVFILVGGILSERLNKKNVISIALIGFAVSLALIPISNAFGIICIAFFFCGGFGGILESLCCALLAEVNKENPDFYINLSTVYFGVGALLGPLTTGIILSHGVNWKLMYYALSLLGVVTFALLVSLRVTGLQKSEGLDFGLLRACFKNRNLLFICLCMALYTGSEVGAWGWMATFLNNEMNFSFFKSSMAVSVFWMGITLGRFLCGELLKKYSVKQLLAALSFLAALATFGSARISHGIIVFFAIAVMGLTYSSIWPLIVSYGSKITGSSSGTVFALVVGSGSAGSAIVPYLMGSVGESSNLRLAMLIPAVLFIFIGIIISSKRSDNGAVKEDAKG